MVYRLLGWGVVVEAYHKMYMHKGYSMCSCASAKITIDNYIMELVHGLTNIPRFTEVGGIQGLEQCCPSKHPPQVIN